MEEQARKFPKDTPPGQPHADPRWKDGKNGAPSLIYPHEVVKIRTKADLMEALEFYSHPMPMLDGSEHLKNPEALRYTLEWVRPALRWYCKAFRVPTPKWLEGNGWADHLDDEERKKYLGNKPLRVREWRENKQLAGSRM